MLALAVMVSIILGAISVIIAIREHQENEKRIFCRYTIK